jgi:hypothetical protein
VVKREGAGGYGYVVVLGHRAGQRLHGVSRGAILVVQPSRLECLSRPARPMLYASGPCHAPLWGSGVGHTARSYGGASAPGQPRTPDSRDKALFAALRPVLLFLCTSPVETALRKARQRKPSSVIAGREQEPGGRIVAIRLSATEP